MQMGFLLAQILYKNTFHVVKFSVVKWIFL